MKLVVLISCMNEKDTSIIARTNLRTDAVIVNQTDHESIQYIKFVSPDLKEHNALFVNTTERGLSRSRNMAIRYAMDADICLICDDDEHLEDDYESTILKAYSEAPESTGLIAFAYIMEGRKCSHRSHKFTIKDILRTSSVQLTFKRDVIINHGIKFDVCMGSGTGNGGGEENRFMMDLWKTRIGMKYIPSVITTVQTGNSKWNNTASPIYFKNLGWTSRRILGSVLGVSYVFYHAISHRSIYKHQYSIISTLRYMLKGFFEQR